MPQDQKNNLLNFLHKAIFWLEQKQAKRKDYLDKLKLDELNNFGELYERPLKPDWNSPPPRNLWKNLGTLASNLKP